MGRRRRNQTDDSMIKNVYSRNMYYNRLVELATSMFEWLNLPDSIDPRFLEMVLFERGHALYFNDDVMGNLALPVNFIGRFDVYNIPIHRHAYASNGYNNDKTDKDSVIIYNNYLRTNSVDIVRYYADRLWNLDRIIDVNANAQKTPVLLVGTETQQLTLKNLYMKWDGNEPVIYGDRDLDLKSLQVLKTDAPYVGKDLYELKNQIWNEALTYLGISNTNTTKKERLITDEVIRNMGGVIASRYSRLQARREAVEKINAMFGTEIEVNYREDYREADDEIMIKDPTEVDNEDADESMSVMVTDLRTRTKAKTVKGGGSL